MVLQIIFIITSIVAIVPWLTISILAFPNLSLENITIMVIVKFLCLIIATGIQDEV
jgi:hypothetical protein